MGDNLINRVLTLFIQKLKFAFSSLIATIADITIYTVLIYWVIENAQIAYVIGAFVGMIINFLIQKKMIFTLKGTSQSAFFISFIVWLVGIVLGILIISYLNEIELLQYHKAIPKIITVGIMFFYNFYLKRFAFEKRLYVLDDK